MHDRCSQETRNKQNPGRNPPDPVASGPNSVPNTKPHIRTPHRSKTPALQRTGIRTGRGKQTRGRYSLIFHP
jgi:hypothetical protein